MTDSARHAYVSAMFERSIALKRQVQATSIDELLAWTDICVDSLNGGGKILFCGNGGSAGDAQHLAAELLVRLRSDVNRQSLPALALAQDTSTITACANDFGFEHLFSRMLEGLGRPGDVLIGITTSGRSANVVNAFETASQRGITALGLLGGDGEPARSVCGRAIVVPSHETARIQECHILLGHALIEMIEEALKAKNLLDLQA